MSNHHAVWRGTSSLTRPDGTVVQPGDPFEPTQTERESFGDLIDLVDDDSRVDVEEPDAAEPSSTDEPRDDAEDRPAVPETSEWTVSELQDWATDCDDPKLIRAARDDEADNKARTTALDALTARHAALTNGEG